MCCFVVVTVLLLSVPLSCLQFVFLTLSIIPWSCYGVVGCIKQFSFRYSGQLRLKHGVWVGLRLNTSSPNCTFSWTDGSTYTYYEPLNCAKSNCLHDQLCSKLQWVTLQMDAIHCTTTRHFLCETLGKHFTDNPINDFFYCYLFCVSSFS